MNNDIEFLICDVAILWRRIFGLLTKDLGISNIERRIILNIDRHPGSTQIEIANLIDIEPQNLIKPLDKLIELQWIEKHADPKDRRIKRLFITKNCQPVLKEIHKIGDTLRPIILNYMNEKETRKFLENITTMQEKLHEHINDIITKVP